MFVNHFNTLHLNTPNLADANTNSHFEHTFVGWATCSHAFQYKERR